METQTTGTSDVNTSTTTQNVTTETNIEKEDLVPASQLRKVLDDMHKFKTEAKALAARLEQANVDKLKQQNDWQSIATLKEKEAQEARTEAEKLRSSIVLNEKLRAIRQEAIKAGLNPASLDDLDLLDYPEVTVETTNTGRMNVVGTDKAILRMKTMRPHWFKAQTPVVNATSPDVIKPGKMTYEELSKVEQEYKKAPGPQTEAAYRQALLRFKQEN